MGERAHVRERTLRRLTSAALATALAVAFQIPIPASATGCPTVIDGNFSPSPPSAGDDLTDCPLTGALLVGVVLTNTNFTGATLTNADFTGATLTNANFTGATLTNANFTGATLTNANFTGATLTNANFTGATITGATFTPGSVENTRVGDFRYSYQYDAETDTFEPGLQMVDYTGTSGSVTIPGSALNLDVTRVDGGAFDDPSSITSVTFANTLTTIGVGAFVGTQLTSLTLPTSLVSIESTAFYGIATLEGSLSIPNSVTAIGDYAFKGTRFTSLTLGSSVQTIGVAAFESVPITGSLSIPSSTTSIGTSAFYGTSFDGGLTLRSGLTTIGESAFEVLPSRGFIGGLTIPGSVTSIGSYAFRGNEFTTLTIMSGSSEMTIGTSAFAGISTFAGNLTVPARVVSIGTFAFDSAGFTGTLTLPNSLTAISAGAFNSTGFTTVGLGNSVTSIGARAFESVPATGPLTMPEGLTTVGERAFYNTHITSLTLPSTVTSIGPDAFSSIEELTASITLPSGLTSLGTAAFYGSGVTGSVVIPSAVTVVPASVFGVTQVSAVTFPSGLTSIGAQAFWRTSIETVTFPSTLTSIGAQAFALRLAGSTDITGGTFTFEGPAPAIDATAFEGADGLVVRYPEGAAGWPLPSALFGTASTQTAIPRPPSPSPSPSESSATTPTSTSTPTQTAVTVPTVSVAPPANPVTVANGAATMLIGGKPTEVTRTPENRGSGFTVIGGGVSASAVPPPMGFSSGGTSTVTMSGYAPDSQVEAFLFSTPVPLGALTVGVDGIAKGTITIPTSVPPGNHTLQFTGWTPMKEPVVLSAGITVKPQVKRVVQRVTFIASSRLPGKQGRASIPRVVADSAALVRPTRTVVTYPGSGAPDQVRLAHSRAKTVVASLRALGLMGPIAVVKGRAGERASRDSQVVMITVTGSR
jgi:hypothetical protein